MDLEAGRGDESSLGHFKSWVPKAPRQRWPWVTLMCTSESSCARQKDGREFQVHGGKERRAKKKKQPINDMIPISENWMYIFKT